MPSQEHPGLTEGRRGRKGFFLEVSKGALPRLLLSKTAREISVILSYLDLGTSSTSALGH